MAAVVSRRLSLTTPSLGVQQWRDDASNRQTRIAWATTGSRGLARTLLMLPVVRVPDGDRVRWVPPGKLMDELESDPAAFWRDPAHQPLRRDLRREALLAHPEDDPTDLTAPRATSVSDDCGGFWAAHHLVVLLVSERQVIGPADDGAELSEEVASVKKFFGDDYDHRRVARGLVRLPRSAAGRRSGEIVFALASCQYPADITDGAPSDHRGPEAPASASLLALSRLLTPMTPASPSLLILAGDQIYVDATAGLFDARSQDDRLRVAYENFLSSPGVQSVFGLLPVAMILDDHEIADNWEPGVEVPPAKEEHLSSVERQERFLGQAKREYRRFQRMAGPPLGTGEALWCDFRHSGVPFFVADTRTQRRTRDGAPRRVDNWRDAWIMDEEQWRALERFLERHAGEVSFVVSPSMLLPREFGHAREPSFALVCDGWDGFPASMQALLALICDNNLSRAVFLSGDAHASCVARATVSRDGRRVTFWSVHSSGLYCPYPFVNGVPDDYAAPETFAFRHGDRRGARPRYDCAVEEVTWVPGDGFATLSLTGGEGGKNLCVRFHRAGRETPHEVRIPL